MSCSVVHSIFLEQRQNQKLFVKSFMIFCTKNFTKLQLQLSKILVLIFLLILKGWILQKHYWFTKASWKFLKNNFLPCFARHFSLVPTTTRNMHVLSRERTFCNLKAWRILPCACVEKILASSPLSRLTSSRFRKVSINYACIIWGQNISAINHLYIL